MTTRRAFLFRSVPSAAALGLVAPNFALASPDSKTLPAPSVGIDTASSELRPYVERFSTDQELLHRFYSIPFAPQTHDRMRKFYTEWQGVLAEVNFDKLSEAARIDYILFSNYLSRQLGHLEEDTHFENEAAVYIPFADMIIALFFAQRDMEPIDGKQSAASLSQLQHACANTQKDLEAKLAATKEDPKSTAAQRQREAANRAAEHVATLRQLLHNWFEFYNGYDPMFTWWAEEPYKTTDSTLDAYGKFLREKVVGLKPPPGEQKQPSQRGEDEDGYAQSIANAHPDDTSDIIGHAIGRDALLHELQFAMIPYTPEELIAIAEKEFAWNDAEMIRASREMGFGDDWKKALDKVKNTYVEPGKQTELARKYVLEALEFIDQHDLVTVPPLARETWRMRMIPPQQQLVSPFFLGGEVLQISYPTNTMSYDQRITTMRANNIAMSHATVFHEMMPGHELQGFMEHRYRTYRLAFGGTPFLIEGWALYWEMLFWDMGFDHTPEERVGALAWRRHRCGRIVFSLNFHLGKWTPQQCIDLLVDRVGFERQAATGEVRRSLGGEYGPLYQAAYLLGGMQIYALHRELVGSGKMTNRQFHDAVLKENNIPIEMIRASLTRQNLTKDFHTQWKFYGDVTAATQ
ncbi:DUF885 family protein [Alloacidobacterium dinghuense]|uniref:DUF885 family protein n=1 Tax=Alloacidobacterium dinghuense TaxID=2763107 RepID=A0A7G8BFE8_9BACT|nr:DUF885 family protein [Alloacidobacterium dinghuense]QNI31268.1 DUF885 family protein [Alloacidobacterium dinghuense]